MMISRIGDVSTVLKTMMLLGITACTENSESVIPYDEELYQEMESVVNAVKRSGWFDLKFKMDKTPNIISEAANAIKDCDVANFYGQNLTKIPTKGLGYMDRIRLLILSKNENLKFTQEDIDFLKEKKLTGLSVPGCNIEVQVLRWFLSIPTLEDLDISYMNLSSILIPCLDGFKSNEINVNHLSVAHTGIDKNGFMAILTKFPKLKFLDISGNESISKSMGTNEYINFGPIRKILKHLMMRNTGFDYRLLKSIGGLECLETLMISSNQKSVMKMLEEDIIGFGNLKKTLKKLSMRFFGINSKWLDEICKLEKLESLTIGDEGELNTDAFRELDFSKLSKLKNLRYLYLHSNDLDSNTLDEIQKALPNVIIEFF